MHFLYVDEAGQTGKDLMCKQQPVFAMASICVSDEKWKTTSAKILKAIADFFDGHVPSGFELHSSELLSPDGQGSFEGYERNKRNHLAKHLLSILAQRGHKAFMTVVHKSHLSETDPPDKDYGFDWKDPWELSFDSHLTMFEEFLRSSRTGQSSTDLVIVDHDNDYLDFIRTHSASRQAAVGWRLLKKIVEIGYTAASHANPMIQMADLAAFVTKKSEESETAFASDWLDEAKLFFQECRGILWDRVEFKRLSFQKLNVPSHLTAFLKEIRKPR